MDFRIPYLILNWIWIALAAIMRFWGNEFAVNLFVWKMNLCDTDICYGVGVVYRLMFALFLFFGVLALIALCPGCHKVSNASFIIKIIVLIALTIVSFLIPHGFFEDFVYYVFAAISAVFLVVQIILLVDWAYRCSEGLHEKEMFKTILAVSAILYLGCLGTFIGIWVVYASQDGCGAEGAFNIVTLVLTLIVTIISATSWCEHGAILPSAIVSIYSYWMLFSAMADNTRHCNPYAQSGTSVTEIVTGFIVLACSVTWAGFNISRRSAEGAFNSGDDGNRKKELRGIGVSEDGTITKEAYIAGGGTEDKFNQFDVDGDGKIDASEMKRDVSAFSFNMTMMSCAAYAAMLLSDWGITIAEQSGAEATDSINGVVWIQLASQWVCMLLYLWSLIAPYLLSGRDFS